MLFVKVSKRGSYGDEPQEGYGRFRHIRALSGREDMLPFVISRDRGPFVSKQRLIQSYGWTRSLIDRFLGDPDEQTRNKHNRSRKTALYNIERVEEVQMSSEFRAALQEANKRRLATAKAVETKRKRLDSSPAKVQFLERDILVEKACKYFDELIEDDARFSFEEPMTPERCELDVLDFIVALYVRDKLTTLQVAPGRSRRPIDWPNADQQTKRKAVYEIGKVYPWLFHECKKQLEPGHRDKIAQDECGDLFLMS